MATKGANGNGARACRLASHLQVYQASARQIDGRLGRRDGGGELHRLRPRRLLPALSDLRALLGLGPLDGAGGRRGLCLWQAAESPEEVGRRRDLHTPIRWGAV